MNSHIFLKAISLLLIIVTMTSCSAENKYDMGIFSNLFGKRDSLEQGARHVDTSHLIKTATMLDEELYWSIIAMSLKRSGNQNDQKEFLIKEIGKLTPLEIIGFRLRTDKLLYDTYNSDMWCAGHIMNGGCSDDGFEYFRNWVISRGKETYYKAKQKPDDLIGEVVKGQEVYDFEDFWYVALQAFKNRTGKDLYDYIDHEHFKTREGLYPPIKFTWEQDHPETMREICPKLFDKLWHR